jgi:acyl carrier protein
MRGGRQGLDSNKARQVLADVLRIDAACVEPSTSRDNTPEWDSLKHITLVMALEEEFGVALEVDEIEAIHSFADLLRIVGAKA